LEKNLIPPCVEKTKNYVLGESPYLPMIEDQFFFQKKICVTYWRDVKLKLPCPPMD
jgi:hypothetical protein